MTRSKAKFRRNKIAGMLWFAGSAISILAYWGVMTNFVIRDFYDPLYAKKIDCLRAAMQAYPRHPLWVVFGSSHVEFGLKPEVLADRMGNQNAPLIFNFGMGGSDMLREYICLRRLLRDGIKPQKVWIETAGNLMDREKDVFADDPKLLIRVRRDEIGELCTYSAEPVATRRYWLQSRLNPFYKYGMEVPFQTLPWRLLPIPRASRFEMHPYDMWGWFKNEPGFSVPESISAATYAKYLEDARKEYNDDFKENFAVAPNFDRSLCAALDLCRKAGVEAHLLWMPEDTDFQAFYPASEKEAIESYLGKIESEYGVGITDARPWFPGRENFLDGHHLNGAGTRQFTLRFADETEKQ